MTVEHCSQCGEETNVFVDGYCTDCQKENQKNLDDFNFNYDRWQSMSDAERDAAIKNAS